MFGWKSLVVGAVLVGGLKVVNAYHKDVRANTMDQRTDVLSYVAKEMEQSAQSMVDGEFITRAQVQPFPVNNLLRVTYTTTIALTDLKDLNAEVENEVSAAVCGETMNTLSEDSDLTIQVIMETQNRERGVDFAVSRASCLAKGYS